MCSWRDLKVYQDYDVKLMFTDIGSSAIGNNKFYIIQVLEGRGSFWSWNRWGRLGENGQNKQCATPQAAIQHFERKLFFGEDEEQVGQPRRLRPPRG